MNIIDISVAWAKGEVFSAKIVALISLFTLVCSLGFYLWGKTEVARAYWLPLTTAGVALVVIAIGLFSANNPRIESFQTQYKASPEAFIKAELERTAKSERDLNTIVFRVLPLIVVACAVGVIFIKGMHWRAWLTVMMVLTSFLMVLDSNTKARNMAYRQQLLKL